MSATEVAVVVPRRADGGRRDALWSWVADRWRIEHPSFQVVEGHHEHGPFNRSAAINAAVAQADPFDVLVIADADSYIDADQLLASIEQASATGQVTFAHDRFCYLDRPTSDRILAGWTGPWKPGIAWELPTTQSSMVVIPAVLWNELGGADEGFVGWGGEDIALSLALQAFGGGHQRISGPVWHLWHPTSPDSSTAWKDRLALYGEAFEAGPEAMRALIARLRTEQYATTRG